jgi:Spy/CpxP family protein refolding chaperone
MEVNEIITELKAQRDAIDRAIALLRGEARPAGYSYRTPEQRRNISEGMKKHWIERKKKLEQKAA